MNEEDLTQEEIDEYNKRRKEEYDEATKGNEEIRKKQEQGRQLDIPGLFESRSGLRRGASLAFEIGANTLVDPLSVFDPTGASQYAAGTFINYLAQKIRGGEISAGELTAAGLSSLIPGGAQGRALIRFGKGAVKGAATGAIEATSVAAIDENRLPTAGELGASAGFGAAFGGALSTPQAQKAAKEIAKKVDDASYDLTGALLRAGLRETNPLLAQGAGVIPPPRQGAKQLLTELPKGASFNTDEVNDYATRALVHREGRVMQGGKQNLMKDFNETLKNKSGQEFIFVRKSSSRASNPAAIENYTLKNVKDVEADLVASLGFDKSIPDDVKALKITVSELNKIEQQNPNLYLTSLMEYGDKAYLEHKIARKQFAKFWNRVEQQRPDDIQNNLFQWTGSTNRNRVGNLRLLLDPNFKKLKDATESRFVKSKAYKEMTKRNIAPEDIVITIEDPGSTTFGANNPFVRSNPGNIQFRKAGTGELVGSIPDYYRQFYSTQFAEGYTKNYGFLADPNNPAVLPKFRARAGESVDQYRKRIINNLIDEAMSGNYDNQNFEADYLEEIAQFYDLFHDKLGWVRLPSWANDIITGKIKFADRLQSQIDEFEIENAAIVKSPVMRTLAQSNKDMAIKEMRSYEKSIRDLQRQIDDPNFSKGRGPILTSLRRLRRQMQEEIARLQQQYGFDSMGNPIEEATQIDINFDGQ